jgi:hypothetical protein
MKKIFFLILIFAVFGAVFGCMKAPQHEDKGTSSQHKESTLQDGEEGRKAFWVEWDNGRYCGRLIQKLDRIVEGQDSPFLLKVWEKKDNCKNIPEVFSSLEDQGLTIRVIFRKWTKCCHYYGSEVHPLLDSNQQPLAGQYEIKNILIPTANFWDMILEINDTSGQLVSKATVEHFEVEKK